MSDPRLSLILAAKDLASPEVNKLHKSLDKVYSGALKTGGGLKHLAGGIFDLGKKAAFAAVAGIGVLTAGLLGAIKASADEQVGIARLNQSLKDNVKGWHGTTAAIEKTIAIRERLGFSDDDQRKSLAQLLVKTHDVTKAMKLQVLAMDLARQQGIDLGSATDVLIKIQNGQYRALKGLGIAMTPVTTNMDKLKATTKHATVEQVRHAKALDDAATKAKAMAAIQKATAGQAKAYGNTTAGAFEAIKITVGDVVEDLGGIFLPMVKQVAFFVRDNVVPALSKAVTVIGAWVKQNQPLINQLGGDLIRGIQSVGRFIIDAIPHVVDFGKSLVDIGKQIFTYVVPKVAKFIDTLMKPGGVKDSVAKAAGSILDKLVPAISQIVDWLVGDNGLIPKLGDLAGVLWGNDKGPLAVALHAVTDFLAGPATKIIGAVITSVGILIDGLTTAIEKLNQLTGANPNKNVGGIIPHISTSGGGGAIRKGANGIVMMPGGVYTVGERGQETIIQGAKGGVVVPSSGGGRHGHAQPAVAAADHGHAIYLDGKKVGDALAHAEYYGRLGFVATGNRT